MISNNYVQYSHVGRTDAEKSISKYKSSLTHFDEFDAMVDGFESIEGVFTTDYEKELAKMGKAIGKNMGNIELAHGAMLHVMEDIAAQIPGGMGSVIARMCMKAYKDISKTSEDDFEKGKFSNEILETGFETIARSNFTTDANKNSARKAIDAEFEYDSTEEITKARVGIMKEILHQE